MKYALANKATGQLGTVTFTNGDRDLEYDENYGTSQRGKNLRVHTDIIDYNGDGRMDVVVYGEDEGSGGSKLYLSIPQSNGTWRLAGSGTELFSNRYRYADVNSDGLLDAYRLVVNAGAGVVPAGYDLEVRYLAADTDAAATSSAYYAYGAAQTHAIGYTLTSTSEGSHTYTWTSLEEAELSLADVNGDGRADLVLWGYDNHWQLSGLIGSTTSLRKRLEVFVQTDTTTETDGVTTTVTSFERYGEAGGIPLEDAAHLATGTALKTGLDEEEDHYFTLDVNGDGNASWRITTRIRWRPT